MQINTISPSKLERLRLCEARVEVQLHDDGYDEEQGEPARIGILAHEAAKLWYRPLDANASPQTFRFSDPGECFRVAIEDCSHKISPATKEPMSELPKEASSIQDARTLFDQIISHYNRNVLKIVFAERRYKGTLTNGVPVHCILDLGVDRGNGTLELIDYKTGFITITADEMYDKDQVLMNLLLVMQDPEFERFNNKQFTYFWLRKGIETGPISFDIERMRDYEHWLATEYKRILAITTPEESLNRFCRSCGRRDQCLKYRKWVSEAMGELKVLTPEEMKAIDDDVLMAQHEKMGGQIDTLEDYRKAIKNHLKGELAVRQVQEITGKTFKMTMRANSHDSYSVPAVIALCNERKIDPSSVFNISRKACEEIFASDPHAMQTLNLTRKRGQTAPFVSISQVGTRSKKRTTKKKDELPAAPEVAPTFQTAPGSPPMPTTQGPTTL